MAGRMGNMNKSMILHNADGSVDLPKKTDYNYDVGDIISVGSYENQYKCINVDRGEDSIIYHFKQGKTIYTYDY